MKLHVVPTGLGAKAIVFWVVNVAAFFAAPYTNLFFLSLAFLTMLALLSLWWTAREFSGLRAELLAIEPFPAGIAAELALRLSGPRNAYRAIVCRLDLGGRRHTVLEASQVEVGRPVRGMLPALPRGRYPIRAAVIETTWPCGLLCARRKLDAPAELVVYPQPASLPAARTVADFLAETIGAHAVPVGDLGPSAVREFREGDDPRHVDWKATARRQSLAVKEWEADALRGIEISLDRRASSGELEEALSLVAALALLVRENKQPLRLESQDVSGTFGAGHRPWNELWCWLAGATPLPLDAPAPPATSPNVIRLPGSYR